MLGFLAATSSHQLKTIEELAYIIWNEHYIPIIGKAQVDYMLNKFQNVESMSQQIEDGYAYFTINYKDNAIGYLAYNIESSDLFLSKIYILKEYRGKGFGRKAMLFITEQAKKSNCKSISLTVNKNNTNSIKAYLKVGFNKVEELVIDIGNGFVMDDFKMVKKLN